MYQDTLQKLIKQQQDWVAGQETDTGEGTDIFGPETSGTQGTQATQGTTATATPPPAKAVTAGPAAAPTRTPVATPAGGGRPAVQPTVSRPTGLGGRTQPIPAGQFPERPYGGAEEVRLVDVPGPIGAMSLPSRGMIRAGNIDLRNRPIIHNKDGSVSTLRAFTVQDDQGHTILLPSVDANGKPLSMPEARRYWQARGQSLGVFDTEANAEAYESTMHDLLAEQYRRMGVFDRPAGPRGRPGAARGGRVWSERPTDVLPSGVVPGRGFASLAGEAAAPPRTAGAGAQPDVLNPPSAWQAGLLPFLEARRTISGPQQLPGPALGPAPAPALRQPVTPPQGFIQAGVEALQRGVEALQRGQPRRDPFPFLGAAQYWPGSHQARVIARAGYIMPRWRHLSATDRHRAAQWFGPAVTAWLDRNAP
jgi:hypothetical protein